MVSWAPIRRYCFPLWAFGVSEHMTMTCPHDKGFLTKYCGIGLSQNTLFCEEKIEINLFLFNAKSPLFQHKLLNKICTDGGQWLDFSSIWVIPIAYWISQLRQHRDYLHLYFILINFHSFIVLSFIFCCISYNICRLGLSTTTTRRWSTERIIFRSCQTPLRVFSIIGYSDKIMMIL